MKIKIAKGGIGMGTWNHRVIWHKPVGRLAKLGLREPWLGIHEVYYDEKGKVRGWTAEATSVTGESTNELIETLTRMLRACDQPVLCVSGETLVEMRPGSKEARGALLDTNGRAFASLKAFRTALMNALDEGSKPS